MSTLSNLQIFQDEVYLSTTELVAEQIALFNDATQGCIALIPGGNTQGDFLKEAYWGLISGLVRRRDPDDRSSSVSAVNISQLLKTSVKIAAGTPPINIDPDTLRWINKDPEDYAMVIAEQLAPAMLKDMLGSCLTAFISAVRSADNGDGTYINDITTGADDGLATFRELNNTAKKFGDRADSIKCWVIHSTPMFGLWDEGLQNSAQLFVYGDVSVRQDPFGRPFVMTDMTQLVASGSPDGYYTLGLVPGAVACQQNNDYEDNIETSNGKENISRTFQAQWTYTVGVKGFQWTDSTAPRAPSDAELATEGNWTQIATSNKDTGGVILLSDG